MHFIRLIRPVNLLIVALTMYGLGWYFETIYSIPPTLGIFSFSYSLLILSTVMIAAAGNIINDYFDVRADRINKPERLIIGKWVKRRVAIVSHWIINFFAFCIALYLSWTLNTFWYLFIHLLTINLLWFYSLYMKRQFLIGNVVIASLTALVPVLVGFYFHQMTEVNGATAQAITRFPFTQYEGDYYVMWLSFGLASFAFVLNLAREIIKDMEDVEGDKKLNAKTIPIVLGNTQSKWYAFIVLLGCVVGTLYVWLLFDSISIVAMLPIALSALLVLLIFMLLIFSSTKKDYHRINLLIKLAMVFGMISPIYWTVMIFYEQF